VVRGAVALGQWIRWWWTALTELLRAPRRTPALEAPHPERDAERVAGAAARCITCGACDRAFDAWTDAPRDRFFGPMTFVLRARSPGEWPRLGPMASAMARGNLGELEAVCPAKVPFETLVSAVRARVPPPAPPPPRPKRGAHHDPG
jgi:hypothetical protein